MVKPKINPEYKNILMWLKCDICERTFGFRRTLIGHVAQVHSDEKPFICEFSGCTWSFALKKGKD